MELLLDMGYAAGLNQEDRMTDDERTLLLEVAKYCYATGMNKLISGAPLAEAIKKFEPDFELRLQDKPGRGD